MGVQTAGGDVVRVVAVALVHVRRSDGLVLARVGEYHHDKGSITGKCQLPGSKLRQSEAPSDAVNRICREELTPFSEGVVLEQWDRNHTDEVSARFRVHTKYMRTTAYCRIDDSFSVPVMDSAFLVQENAPMSQLISECNPTYR